MREIKIGQKFRKLKVVEEYAGGHNVHKKYKCLCDCGNQCVVSSQHLGKDTFSCGCLVNGREYKYSLYNVYKDMKRRCYNPNRANYKYYGGKGIRVCDEWLKSFKNFKEWAIKNGYKYESTLSRENRLSLDRIDPNKNYEPSNCRWITFKENRKRRNQ